MEGIIYIAAFIVAIFVLRLLGAWMLRIYDVINLQNEILQELREIRQRL